MKTWDVRYLCRGMTEEEIHLIQKVLNSCSVRLPQDVHEIIVSYYLSEPRNSIAHPLMQLEKEKLKPKIDPWEKLRKTIALKF